MCDRDRINIIYMHMREGLYEYALLINKNRFKLGSSADYSIQSQSCVTFF